MTIETVLLIMESVLLAATICLLLYSIREGKHRDTLIQEVSKATKILTRQEYFLNVMDAMLRARTQIIGSITGRPPSEDDLKRVNTIMEDIEKVIGKGVRIRYLIPRFPDRLSVGQIYSRVGAEVRYSNALMVQDLRYIVVDDKLVVLGIPESTGDKEATKKGYRIPSQGLSTMLSDNFMKCWEQGVSYEDYAREVIKESGTTPALLAQKLRMDEEELKRFAGS